MGMHYTTYNNKKIKIIFSNILNAYLLKKNPIEN